MYKWMTAHFQIHTSGKWFEFMTHFIHFPLVFFFCVKYFSSFFSFSFTLVLGNRALNGLCFHFNSSPYKHKAARIMASAASCFMNFCCLNNVRLFMKCLNRSRTISFERIMEKNQPLFNGDVDMTHMSMCVQTKVYH